MKVLANESDSDGSNAGTIVPLYTVPTDRSWRAVVGAKAKYPGVPVVAIVNPASGPGSARSLAYASGITRLKAGGITVIGYVATDYARKSSDSVQAAVDLYHSWYPNLDGIFFDEMSDSPSTVSYYAALTQYVKALGMTVTVGNPGTEVPPSLVGTVDVVLVYEDSGLPPLDTIEQWQSCRTSVGIIPYAVPSLDAGWIGQAKQHVRWIYVTNDALPNPWNSLPGYFEALLDALSG